MSVGRKTKIRLAALASSVALVVSAGAAGTALTGTALAGGGVHATASNASITAPAIGGGSIASTTARIGGDGAWTTLTGPVVTETAVGQLKAGFRIILSLPGDFEWNMANTRPPTVANCSRTATSTVYLSATSLSVTLAMRSGASTMSTCRIDFGTRLQVRPVDASLAGSAGDITAAIATGSGSTPIPGSAGFLAMVTTPIAGSLTLEATSAGMKADAIDWGTAVSLTTNGTAGQSFQLQVSGDHVKWETLRDGQGTPLSFAIGTNGAYTYVYRPIRNYWYRAIAGATTSNTPRVAVRQTIALRPSSQGIVKASPGTRVTFTATVRPARPGLAKAKVVFQLYRRVGASWRLQQAPVVTVDGHGIARHTFSITSGTWYVRAQARPTPVNANSLWSPIRRIAA